MKKVFFFAISAFVAAGCSNETVENVFSENAESTLLSVSLKSAGINTRASVGTYELGTDKENNVQRIDFYFFDAAGKAYQVTSTGSNQIGWTKGANGDNIEKKSDVILVIKKSEKAPPAKVVAIINDNTDYQNVNLGDLGTKVVKKLHDGNTDFIMSNSVYYDENNNVNVIASTISQENIFTTNDALTDIAPGNVLDNDVVTVPENVDPIDIYVERVAAKVRVNGAEGVDLQKMPVYDEDGTTQLTDAAGNAVYAKILGWDLTNTTDEAYLVKKIDGEWSNDFLGFTWNDAPKFRSYWAETTAIPGHKCTFDAIIGKGLEENNYGYYFENTKPAAEENSVTPGTEGSNQATQLLVAAQLVNENGTEIQLAKWYNVLYTIEKLKTAMINTIASKVYVKADGWTEENKVYRSISVDDVVFYQREATETDNRYEVLVKAKDGVEYYQADGNPNENAQATIAAIEPAQMWKDGYTYYYTTIKHFGNEDKRGEFGIVRNHIYDITLSKVMGFGTPVYDPSHVIVPEKCDAQEALNLAAQINILSWHIVSQDVILGN